MSGNHIGTCERCGIQRTYAYASFVKRFCSHACSNAAKWEIRQRAESVSLQCVQCKSVFTLLERSLRQRLKSGKPPKYCGKACESVARTKAGTMVERKCDGCGAIVQRRHDLAGVRTFCSRQCQSQATTVAGSRWGRLSDPAARTEYMRSYSVRNRKRANELSRAWSKRNPEYRKYLCHLRRAAGNITFEQWNEVAEKCNHQCVACHSTELLQMDHIVAVAVGGKTEVGNLQLLCRSCNISKGKRPFAEWLLWRHGIEILEIRS